jgi:hypothetical protein
MTQQIKSRSSSGIRSARSMPVYAVLSDFLSASCRVVPVSDGRYRADEQTPSNQHDHLSLNATRLTRELYAVFVC